MKNKVTGQNKDKITKSIFNEAFNCLTAYKTHSLAFEEKHPVYYDDGALP